jgi:lactate dehydrogenase-like 2-hydroxyacid dehydrogenase
MSSKVKFYKGGDQPLELHKVRVVQKLHLVPIERRMEALKEGEIAGAAMDVYEHEPQIHPELLTLDNVVLSPHTGTGTWEGRIAMCENVCDNILAWERKDIESMDIVL